MISQQCEPEVAVTQQIMGAGAVIRRLHDQCSQTIEFLLHGANEVRLAESYLFAGDLDAWRKAIDGQLEASLVETAASEYALATLNVCQGQ